MGGHPMKTLKAGKLLLILIFTLCTLLLSISSADAVMIKMTLEELTEEADSIVVGTVVSTNSQWNDARTSIFTEVVVSVEKRMKGVSNTQEITVLVPGGETGGIVEVISVMPVFTAGERVMLFLKDLSSAKVSKTGQNQSQFTAPTFSVHGNFQGKLDVVEDKLNNMPLHVFENQIDLIMQGESSKISLASGDDDSVFVSQSSFVYNGQKWFGDWPVVNFKVNTAGSQSGSLTALQNAANTWSNAGAKFTFSYGGSHSRSGAAVKNSINEITWDNLGANQTLAYVSWWYYSSGEIFEADMVINTHHNWSSASPTPYGYFDVETVALHEFGHWLSLGHSGVYDSIMWWQYKEPQQALHADDIAAIKYIYGPADLTPMAPTLLSPQNGAVTFGPAVTFQWGAVSGATQYWLRVERASDGMEIINNNLGNVTSFTQSGFLNDGTTYIWSVSAGNDSGWSDLAPARSFTMTRYTVLVSAAPVAGGTVFGGGTYNQGDSVTVTALPNAEYQFVNWTTENGSVVSTDSAYLFVMTSNRSLVANFSKMLFSDTVGHRYQEAIQTMVDLGVLAGRGDGKFYPDDTLLRAEAAKVAGMLMGYTEEDARAAMNDDIFKDVHANMPAHSWARGWINLIAAEGVILGDGTGNYNPGGTLLRTEWGTILLRVLLYSTQGLKWPDEYDDKILELGLDYDIDYIGLEPVTRAEMARFSETAVFDVARFDGKTLKELFF
jgi:hypothetical protein